MRLPPSCLVLGALALAVAGRAADPVKNPDTYVVAAQADANSLDPAWVYDSVSAAVVENMYENLFAFEGGSTEKLVPLLATKVPTKENGLISPDGLTYRIPIRKGVKFHDGTTMTVDDVRYSLLRFMLQDRASGPSGLLLEPLLGYASTRDAKGVLNKRAFHDAVRAVEADGEDAVVLKLPRPFAPLLSVLASWAPVVSKRWAIRRDDWHGTEGTWEKFNNPSKESSPFFAGEMGTGPFKLERWDRKLREVVLARHDAYWRGPAKLKRAVVKAVPEFGTRRLMLLAGDADAIAADRSQISQLRDQPGVQIIDDLPALALDPILFFSYKINPAANPFIGSGRLDGEGIPPVIEDALKETDLAKRLRLYARLQEIEHEELPHLVLVDQARFRVQRSWVKGWVHSPIHTPEGGFFYPLSKAP